MRTRPIVIAHRGASGYRPEHTLASYALAIEQGADFIEPDLVATADGRLIARHENALALLREDGSLNTENSSTDVHAHPEFAHRLARKRIDGVALHGWFSEDFTLAEVKTLRAVERIPALRPANTGHDGRYEIPSFEEIIELVQHVEASGGRRVGIYPETKHPSYFAREGQRLDGAAIGVDLGRALVETLVSCAFTAPSRVFIQSFESANLQALAHHIMPRAGVRLPLIQLIEADGAPRDFELAGDPRRYADLITPSGCAFVAGYAQGLGVPKKLILDGAPPRRPSPLVATAHAHGLDVHVWTFRAENQFLPPDLRRGALPAGRGDLEAEVAEFLATGIDGLFMDNPDVGVAALLNRAQ